MFFTNLTFKYFYFIFKIEKIKKLNTFKKYAHATYFNMIDFPAKNRPLEFTLDDGSDELYMIGSQAGAYMGLFRGAIYKKFPYIWRRLATSDEKPIIQKKFINEKWKLGSSITLVKAIEILNILKGFDEEYIPRYIPIKSIRKCEL